MSGDNSTGVNPLGNVTAVGGATVVAAVPTAAMIIGSLLVVYCRPTEIVKASLQNLSAGIILAAIAGELFPLLAVPEGEAPWATCGAILVGFIAGAALMFILGAVLDKCESEDEDEDEDDDNSAANSPSADLSSSLLENGTNPVIKDANIVSPDVLERVEASIRAMQQCLSNLDDVYDRTEMDFIVHRVSAHIDDCKRQVERQPVALTEEDHAAIVRPLSKTRDLLDHMIDHIAGREFCQQRSVRKHLRQLEVAMSSLHDRVEAPPNTAIRRWSIRPDIPDQGSEDEPVEVRPIPISLMLAVSVDGFVDGFLIGLSYIANFRAGFVMAGATCVEMGFLGVSYCASLLGTHRPLVQIVWLVLVPPIALLLGAAIAGAIGAAIEGTVFFTGFIAFAVVALFFLVTQELLLEANENLGGKEIPWVNLMLFIGILLIVLVQNIVG